MYLSYSEETTEGGWKTHSPPIVIELMNRHLKDFLDFFFLMHIVGFRAVKSLDCVKKI